MNEDLFASDDFKSLSEDDQVTQLSSAQPSFAEYYESDPEGAMELLREKTGKPADSTSMAGRIIRQFGSGLGEAAMDTLALPFDTAEFVASKVGSDWSTTIDDSIEEYSREKFPEATTPEGKIARSVGYWGSIGLQTYMTGGALGYLGRFPVKGASKLATAGKFLSGGAKVEIGAGLVGGAAEGSIEAFMDENNPAKPWLAIGAGIIAGGATGIAISARAAAKRARRATKRGEQPTSPGGDVPSSSPDSPESIERLKLEAADQATTDEINEMLGQDALGRDVAFKQISDAQRESARLQMKGWTRGTFAVMDDTRFQQVVDGVTEVMKTTGRTYDPGRGTFMKHLQEVMWSGDISRQEANQILKGFDTSVEQIADITYEFGETASLAGSILGRLSAASKKVKKDILANATPEEIDIMRALAPELEGLSLWKRLENVRRGLLVTQIATAARNLETQIANVTIHALEDTVENAVMRGFGKFGGEHGQIVKAMHPTNAWGTVIRLMGMLTPGKSKTFKEFQELKKHMAGPRLEGETVGDFNKRRAVLDPIEASFSADINIQAGIDPMGSLEKLTLLANSANRLQEFSLRRAIFTADLDRTLSRKGQSLSKVIEAGKIGKIDRDDIKDAVGRALEGTWGENYMSNMDGAAGIAGSAVQFINKVGWGPLRATQVIPFPRFMMNSLKWQYQHSPLPMMKMLVSPDEWKRIANGDVQPIIKSSIGTGMLLSAYQLQNSEYRGSKWYKLKPSVEVNRFMGEADDAEWDIRAYNPFSSYLFAADLIRRSLDGEQPRMSTRDVAMGFLSVNLRAGAGMYVLDQFLDSIGKIASNSPGQEESFAETIRDASAGYMGAAWAGMLVPFQQLKDIARHFDESLGTDNTMVRDTSDAPFAGQLARKLPYADENLPGVELATRAEPPRTEAPVKRGLLGLTVSGRQNAVEKELDRLGFTQSNIIQSSGNKEWDTLRKKHMGPIVEQQLPALVESDWYQSQDRETQQVALEMAIARARNAATKIARVEDPDLAWKVREGSRGKFLRRLASKRKRDVEERQVAMERLRTAR